MLTINATDGRARTGQVTTAHGVFDTPAFMPVGTAGTVKMLTPRQVRESGSQVILGNTYHLLLRPGTNLVADLGGLHTFAGWDGPILTDSGGYQVFSLARLNKLTDEGVTFRSHIDGAQLLMTPESVLDAQADLGSDIAMVLDECPPADATRDEVATAVQRTLAWARRSKAHGWQDNQAVFAIGQGGRFEDLRRECAQGLVDMDFPGYAIGGVSVGEGLEAKLLALDVTAAELPADKARYAMGIGEPADILAAVSFGCDMFDCVLPTRNGRNGTAFTYKGSVNVRNSRFKTENGPVEEGCNCYCCSNFSIGYIRHLFNVNEALGPILVSIHNISFFARFMRDIRAAISAGSFKHFSETFLQSYTKGTSS